MLLEGLVSHLLDKYLGDYIENFDSNKLKIDLWNGDVVLENLYLKPNALANFNLPITVITGYLQKLLLHISWKHVYTHPIKITVDGLYLLLAPNTEVKYDPERDEKEQYEAKMKEVHKVEEFRKEREAYENAETSHMHKDTFLERLQLHIIRNLELSISNIHIAYEDKISKPGHPFTFGITLNYIKLYTTNVEWEPEVSNEDSPVIYKFGELNTLSIYWNSNVESRSELSRKNIVDDLHAKIVRNEQTASEFTTSIVRPLNMKAKLKIATTPRQQDFARPVLDADIDLEQISLNINRNQYSDVLDLLELQDNLNLKSKYIKYHAMIETDDIKKPSLRRWKFAYAAVINEAVRPRIARNKWQNIKDTLDRCQEYRTLYFQELIDEATKEQTKRAQELEKNLDVFNLIFIRRTAEIEVKKKKAERKQQSWWDTLSSWWSTNSNNDNPELHFHNVMTADEKKKLYDAIGYEDNQTSSLSAPAEYVDIDLSIRLNMLEVNVWSNVNENDSQLKVIAHAAVPKTGLIFKRRPAAPGFLLVADLGSLQMCGIAETANQVAILNDNRPVLIRSVNRSQLPHEKFLHIEFESNPFEKKLDYRIRAISQSVEITYNALTINKLVECFVPDRHRNLKGVKEAAYSLYTDVKHRTQFLLSYNLKKIKALEIDIDLQSSYFLVPESGVYRDGCSVICLDFGQFTFQNGPNHSDKKEEEEEEAGKTPEEIQNTDDVGQSSYIPLELRLRNIQLLSATENEDWKNARMKQDSRMHLIKPITVSVNVFKCIYSDDASLPIWKADARISPVDARLSNRRIFGIVQLYQSIPVPQSKELAVESPSFESPVPHRNTKKTYETIENMTPVKKFLQEANNAQEKEVIDRQKVDSPAQLTELEACLELPRIDLRIKESLSNMIDHTQPFVRLSLVSFTARTKIKTFDIEFNASLADLIVFHEQFLTKNDDRLRLFTAERPPLLSVKCLLTSPENPLFSSSPYNGIENKICLHIGKSILMLPLEALLSMVQFQNDLMEKLSDQKRTTTTSKSNPSKVTKKNPQSTMSTFQIAVDLEGFRAFIGTQFSQLLDIQLQNLQANISRSIKKTSAHLILSDFSVLDLHAKARHRKIIVQQTHDEPLLRIDLSLIRYPKKYEKTLDDVDCDIQGQLAKINIVFLYKHLDLILNILNAFQTKKNESHASASRTNTVSEIIQKWQDQAFKIRFAITLNAPMILVPTNSHSNEGIFLDLGQLTARTHFIDDPTRSLLEQQVIILKNVFASRIQLNNNDEILGDVLLLECAQFNTSIDRFLHPEKVKNEANISMKVQWDTIELTMAKDDYLCMTTIAKENFSEKIHRKIPQSTSQEKQTNENQVSSSVQNESSDDPVSEQIRIDVQMKKIAVTLDLGESNINAYRAPRNENSKFTNVRIEMLEAYFRQLSNSSYDAKIQIQNFFLDDLRQTNQADSITRLMDRNFNVDSNAPMLMATLEFQPKNKTRTIAVRQVKAQLESLYFCISPDYLMALKDFFIASPSSDDKIKPHQTILNTQTPSDVRDDVPPLAKSISSHPQLALTSSSSPQKSIQAESRQVSSDIETTVDVTIKTPQIILLEDQHNANSSCLVLGFAFQVRLINMGVDTKLSGSVQDLTMFGSNFAELKKSKIKYHILQPTKIEIVLIMNSDEQKIDLRIGDMSLNITPAAIHTIVTVTKSLGKRQIANQGEKEKIKSKTLFDPKPFKNAIFWFIEDPEEKQKMIEQTDILEVTTGTASQKKTVIEEDNKQKEKEKKIQTGNIRSQELILNLDIVEIIFQLGSGPVTKSVVAICLSNLFADVKNWSTDLSISSQIQVELALFNDHILAWEPLIEPIIDERGSVISPWCITCSTMANKDDENENESRFLVDDPKSSSNNEQERKDGVPNLNAQNVIYIRADHMLNITLTKTTLDLAQRLSAMFNDTYKKQLPSSEDNDESMLSVHNMTGYDILISEMIGVQFVKNNSSETSVNLKHDGSVSLTVPGERLSATHLPAIAEQVAKRRQQFSVKIGNKVSTVDINQTWRRVYELGASPIPDWPIQMLCDSQIYNERRRVILSSIVKIYNRTIMPFILLDVDGIEMNKFYQVARIEINEELYLPIDLLYKRMNPRLYIAIDEDHSTKQLHDFISFGWSTESSVDRILTMKNGKEAHFVVYKESIEAYSENTDEPVRTAFHIYIKLALHLINLLPIDVHCSIDGVEQVDLKPSELYHSMAGNKKSMLTFTIPSYDNVEWISEPIDLKTKGHGIHNEHIVTFHDIIMQETLRMILRVDTYRESYRASLYSPFWIVNCTNLKFEFKIDRDKTFIDVVDQPFFLCPKKFDSEAHKKGHIRLYSIEEDESRSQWSEHFSLNVIKSTGMTTCKVSNDRLYTVCVDIVTCSFGMTKIVTLAPSMVVINNSSLEIEVVETVSGTEQDYWKSVKPEEIIPFWPRDVKDGVMRVRYAHNRVSSPAFLMNDKHRTLLHMNDEEHPALHVEVSTTDFDGIHIVFSDYKTGDAPVLLVNCLKNQPVAFCQAENVRSQILPPQHYVYYTWIDPLQPWKLVVSCNGSHATIELNPQCGILETDDEQRVYYAIFHDGPQTVFIFAEETSIIEAVSGTTALSEPMSQYIQIGIRDIGIAIVNDINRDDLFYISINRSKEIWTETRKSLVKPLSHDLNHHLEEHYKTYTKHQKTNPNDEKLAQKKHHIDKHREVSFKEDTAELTDHEGHRVQVKRQALDGLWIGYAWSVSNAALHVRINHVQIDDQLEYTMFPVVLHPIVSKAAGTDIPGKPFIELSIFQTKEARSNTIHFKYFKLLVQEFVFRADQGLIVSIFAFVKSEKESVAPTVNMDADLKRIEKPLQTLVKAEADNRSGEPDIYFDNIHLSPLKIHVSFSIHGAKPSEQLLAEHPLADFLLQILNVAEVQDVILKLNFYERKHDRFTITKLTTEIKNHYQNQFLKQLHVVVLGLDVLGNPFGVLRGVAEGVESFFYEPYQGAMEGPIEFFEGIASGTRHLLGSVVGGAAGAVSKVTGVISKGLATLTLDEDYKNARIQRKELTTPGTPDVVSSGKNTVKDVVHAAKSVVKKPVAGAKENGTSGFIKGLGKGFLGLVARPASGVADLTSTSFDLIKRTATHEEVVHRVRHPRHIGRDGIVRPSTAHEAMGFYIFNRLDIDKYTKSDNYIAHINCSENPSGWLLATTKHLLFVTENSSSGLYEVDWHFRYKELKGAPVVKFDPNQIEILFKEPKMFGRTKKDRPHDEKLVNYNYVGEARYIVDKITGTMHAMEV